MTKRSDAAQPPDLSHEIDKASLVSDLSHELRAVLGGVIGINELLLTTDLSSHQRQLAETIDHSSQILLSVLNDMVDSYRIQIGKIKIEEAPVDLLRIIEETAGTVEKLCAEKNNKLEVICQALPLMIMGDSARLRQIIKTLLLRLLSTVENGTVRLSAQTEAASDGTTLVHIAVTGEPIAEFSEPFLTTLSQPFKPDRKFDSRWLSLYLCAQLVALLNGSCGSTISGKTCELSVSLPARVPGT